MCSASCQMCLLCECAHWEPSLEFIIITVIVVFFFRWYGRVCVCTCALVAVCMRSHTVYPSLILLIRILTLTLVCSGCLCVFVCLIVYACVYLLLFWYEYAPGPFHVYSLHLSVCIDIFFLHQITELLLLLLLYKWCAIICFFAFYLSPLLAHSSVHSFIRSLRSRSLSLCPYHSIKREYSP